MPSLRLLCQVVSRLWVSRFTREWSTFLIHYVEAIILSNNETSFGYFEFPIESDL